MPSQVINLEMHSFDHVLHLDPLVNMRVICGAALCCINVMSCAYLCNR